jgi:GNAT superfamily N-acetyltransferase
VEIVDLEPDHPGWAQALPVLQELRTHLTDQTLRQVLTEGAGQGLRFLGAFDHGRCLGVAGWRLVATTTVLRKIYVDDLVTAAHARGQGIGALLLRELRERATAAGCFALELDSGVQRHDAHRFYMREGMLINAYHFVRPV